MKTMRDNKMTPSQADSMHHRSTYVHLRRSEDNEFFVCSSQDEGAAVPEALKAEVNCPQCLRLIEFAEILRRA